MSFSARQYFQSGIYHVGGRFASFGRFLNLVCSPIAQAPFKVEPVLEHLERCLKPNFVSNCPAPEGRALRQLVQNDLRPLQELLLNPAIVAEIDSEKNVLENLGQTIESGQILLEELGLSFIKPELFFVDKYPPPYTDRLEFAFNMDAGDLAAYGISPGIYFHTNLLRPYYSRYLALHEIIHTALGQRSPESLARGLEEGIAEILGSVYLTQKIMGDTICRNLFIFNRLSADDHPVFDLYLDYARQAFLLYKTVGLQGLIKILNEGRDSVKKWESALWSGKFKNEKFLLSEPDANFEQMLSQLLLVFSRKSVGSPAAVLLSNIARAGSTFKELADETLLDVATVKSALNEIRIRTRFMTFDENREVISFSDAGRIVNPQEFRYSVPDNDALFS